MVSNSGVLRIAVFRRDQKSVKAIEAIGKHSLFCDFMQKARAVDVMFEEKETLSSP